MLYMKVSINQITGHSSSAAARESSPSAGYQGPRPEDLTHRIWGPQCGSAEHRAVRTTHVKPQRASLPYCDFREFWHGCYWCGARVSLTAKWHHGAGISYHDDVIKWKYFPHNWPFVRGIHRSRWIPHTKASDAELWCFFFICVWIKVD